MSAEPDAEELRDEYDFAPEEIRRGERGKYAARYAEGADEVRPGPDSTEVPADGSTTG